MTELDPDRPVLFLDVDGVLNGHDYDQIALSCTLRRSCVLELNRVIEATNCQIVLSSSWRYMVLGGAITLAGFAYLLRTHGVTAAIRIVGHTDGDAEHRIKDERSAQIKAWLARHPEITRYAVVDDMPEENDAFEGLPLVRTQHRDGLTADDANKLIRLLAKPIVIASKPLELLG